MLTAMVKRTYETRVNCDQDRMVPAGGELAFMNSTS